LLSYRNLITFHDNEYNNNNNKKNSGVTTYIIRVNLLLFQKQKWRQKMKKVVYFVLVVALMAVSSIFADEGNRHFEITVSEAGENADVTCGYTVGPNPSEDEPDYTFNIYRSEIFPDGTSSDWQMYYNETNPESVDVVFTTDTFFNLVPNGVWVNGPKTFIWKGSCLIEYDNGNTIFDEEISQQLQITRINNDPPYQDNSIE